MEEAANNQVDEHWKERTRRLTRRWFWLPMVLGALGILVAVWAWEQVSPERVNTFFDTLVDIDLNQDRIDTALPLPRGDLSITQSFVPRHNGLQEIELTLARYGPAQATGNGQLTLQLLSENGVLLAEQTVMTTGLDHNQLFRFSFPRQADSDGRRYLLNLSGNSQNNISVWGYSLDVYGGGATSLIGDPPAEDPPNILAQDLRFITRYRLSWAGALRALVETFYFEGLLFLLVLLFLPLPGCLLLVLYHTRITASNSGQSEMSGSAWPWDPAAWWGTALALGMASWPILWLWLTLIGARWTVWLLWLLVVAGWIAVGWFWWRDRKKRHSRTEEPDELNPPPQTPLTLPWRKEHFILLLILLLGMLVRLLAVRDVVFPPWVDSSRHALITAVMARTGQVISDYAPYLPVDRFPYHYGFHTLSATLSMMSAWPLNRLLLIFGQILNALIPLALYTSVWLASRRRDAALIAAFLVAIPFFFPAYYATWGRFTQLSGVFILSILLALTWRLLWGNGQWYRVWWLVALLAAGLFLTHFRVFIYYLPFVILVWLVSRGRNSRWLVISAGLAILFILPRLFQLLENSNPLQSVSMTIPAYNNFPTSYFNTGWEQLFIYAAAAGVIVAIFAAIRRRGWAALPLVILAWVASLFLLLSADRIGLPGTALVNLNSMYIMLFVPLAMFIALVAGPLWRLLRQQHWLVQLAGYLLIGAFLTAMLIFGTRQQINILNSKTILAHPEDLLALRWADDNLPADATIAVNSWRWLGETWAAADGGAWIVPLIARSVTTPPIDHIYDPDLFSEVRKFNQEASAVTDWADPLQADWLRERGVSHIYVGKKGGFFDPAVLVRNPKLETLYARHGVFIFALDD